MHTQRQRRTFVVAYFSGFDRVGRSEFSQPFEFQQIIRCAVTGRHFDRELLRIRTMINWTTFWWCFWNRLVRLMRSRNRLTISEKWRVARKWDNLIGNRTLSHGDDNDQRKNDSTDLNDPGTLGEWWKLIT